MTDGMPEWKPQQSLPEWIAGRIGTLLDHYFQPNDPTQVTKAQMMDWIRVLRDMPQQAISASCDGYLRDQPRRRPTPGDIYNRCNTWLYAKGHVQRPRLGPLPAANALPPPERNDEDRKRAVEILARAGFTAERKRMVDRNPTARTVEDLPQEAKRPMHWSETAAPDDIRWEQLRKSRAASLIPPISKKEAS